MKKFFKVLFVLLVLVGCSKTNEKEQVNVSELGGKIQDNYYDTVMKKYNDAEVFSMFDLEADSVNQIYYAEAFLDTRSDIIGIFEITNEDAADNLIAVGKAIMQTEIEEFENYIPQEAEKALQAKVYRSGNYVVMICNASVNEISKDLEEALN